MAKKENNKEAGPARRDTAGTQEPPAGDNQGPQIAEIETVEDLEACYPQLVSKIRDGVIEKIGLCTVGQLKGHMPELYERIVIDLQNKSGPKLSGNGFLLDIEDPFAEGTLRTYQKLKKVDGLRLPYILLYKDKVTKVALENYILRANGGGDTERVNAARKAMKKIK